MPRYDLKTPCKNCPFRNDETRIRFRTRGRAEEIEEHAYRNGFACHMSAESVEDPEGGTQLVFGENTQHCAGYIILALKDRYAGGWPGIDNDDELADRLAEQVDLEAPVFETVEEFLDANTPDGDDPYA